MKICRYTVKARLQLKSNVTCNAMYRMCFPFYHYNYIHRNTHRHIHTHTHTHTHTQHTPNFPTNTNSHVPATCQPY